jgi:hypothetical protein
LERRRESYVKALAAVPVPESKSVGFPYASIESAIKDEFKRIGGPAAAFKFLEKGFKTIQWRKVADKNRVVRDAVADGDTKVLAAARKSGKKATPAAKVINLATEQVQA